MGYWFEVDTENKTFRFAAEGRLTDEDLLKGITLSRKIMAARPGIRGICDFGHVREFAVSPEMVRRLAESGAGVEAEWVVVIVAPSDLMFGMSRMYSVLTEEHRPNRHVVRTIGEAYEVLGIRSPEFVRVSAP